MPLAVPPRHPPGDGARRISDVWSWNFDAEFSELLAAATACGAGAVLALDTEFPGFLREEPQKAARAVRYQALRENVDLLRPIQLGVSVASGDGVLYGTWSFNLCFDVAVDLHTEASVAFLSAAGVNFPRHATEGVDPAVMGRRLAASPLVGQHGSRPQWATFAGWYDFGYLLKLLRGWPLPPDVGAFDDVLQAFFPRRCELRDALPHGSLDSLTRERGIERHGSPHTAGSDALATLELFLQMERAERDGANGMGAHPFRSAFAGGRTEGSVAQAALPPMPPSRWDVAAVAPAQGVVLEEGCWEMDGSEGFLTVDTGGWEEMGAVLAAAMVLPMQLLQPVQQGQMVQPLHMVQQAQPEDVHQGTDFTAFGGGPIMATIAPVPELEQPFPEAWAMQQVQPAMLATTDWGLSARWATAPPTNVVPAMVHGVPWGSEHFPEMAPVRAG